ncbi:MAG: hypothetical protein Q8M88_07765 [Phenylobacterium sp.]|uniref:DODA-type extradiol aromatic ring-opening family dioxygenase n=1 Tax=Phenylobacterium sp. TaxID=1871053 RepID=UPI0027339021|nr:hypothetical protein [Phenylobacterium sp.]MDP3174315.1 hypothetical protein [Phenylobacterium sp.]
MIGLGLASSHAPAMFCPPEVWPKVYGAIPNYMKASQPHTAKLETREVIESYLQRIDAAFDVLQRQVEDYKPDAVIFVGDDQEDMFDARCNPAMCIFTGDELWGASAPFYMDQPPEASRIHLKVHQELAGYLLEELLEEGFDMANSSVMKPMGRHPERGTSHMIVYPAKRILPSLDVPIIPIYLNCYYPPLPTAARCWKLGEAVARVMAKRPERIAIYASGGLSHDPVGPRAGWIDEPLDRWVLDRIATNRSRDLQNLFTFDSATLAGGTAETRAWIVAAGACQWKGEVVDYIPAHHAKTGLGFAYWPHQQK